MKRDTSWNKVGKWYDQIVDKSGHFYHKEVIFPKLFPLLNLQKKSSLLDLGCGQGILARQLPKGIAYHGLDLADSLLSEGKKHSPYAHFTKQDVTKPFNLKKSYSHAVILLALQNMEHPEGALKNAYDHLEKEGKLAIVLNHPCFRIPRQSHWGIDEKSKTQYRRIDRYASTLSIPIQAHPSRKEASATTWSFHYSLSTISHYLSNVGFVIESLEEWCSTKRSTGKYARMENRAREEFPLFLTILAKKPK